MHLQDHMRAHSGINIGCFGVLKQPNLSVVLLGENKVICMRIINLVSCQKQRTVSLVVLYDDKLVNNCGTSTAWSLLLILTGFFYLCGKNTTAGVQTAMLHQVRDDSSNECTCSGTS